MGEGELEQAPPLVSVLIVSEDNAAALRRCLAAVEASHQRERFEVLVVDNGSQDESPRLDSEFPNATFLRLPRRFGVVKALNIGMRTAKGEFFFFLAPEVEVAPETIARLAERLTTDPLPVAVCPLLVDQEGRPCEQFYRLPDAAGTLRAALRERWEAVTLEAAGVGPVAVEFPCLAALMIRAYFLKALRYIDERYGQSWAEAEIALQVRRAGRKILAMPDLRVRWEGGELPALRHQARVRALYSADWALGAARYAGKHFGLISGLKVRLVVTGAALGRALLSLLLLREPAYEFARARFLLSGQKLDGTQRFL
ncbi:MAG: glycosyltransferase [Bryobacterales bacterium]|nr:glycosyltransferase [Bryobacteraceae bacterium]MDW8129043.1 glycosyltransferase [Bryobacterales bacterium]